MLHQFQPNSLSCVHAAKQYGFTLIELMIVVAIIGILASVAIPAYSAYVIRAKVTEAVNFADACKTAVYGYYSTNDAWPTSAASAGCSGKTPNVVSSITVDATGTGAITVNIYGARTNIGGACYLLLTPNANGSQWTGSTTCPKEYVPPNFR